MDNDNIKNDIVDFSGYTNNLGSHFAEKIFELNPTTHGRIQTLLNNIVHDYKWGKEFSRDTINLFKPLVDKEDFWENFQLNIHSIDLIDLITIYLFCLLKSITNEKLVIIIFDNIDKIKFPTESDKLLGSIFDAITKTNNLDQINNRGFLNKFRFLFSTREANHVYLNQHSLSTFGPTIASKEFRFVMGADFSKSIIVKRINVLSEVTEEFEENPTKKNILDLLNKLKNYLDDNIFYLLVGDLFNYDIRELIVSLFFIAKDRKINISHGFDYGIRGTLIYHIVSFLSQENLFFGHNYLGRRGKGVGNAYCEIQRTLLTVILNLSPNVIKEYSGHLPMRINQDDVSLFYIFKFLSGLYDVNDIAKEISGIFLDHTKNWVSLLIIYGKKVINSEDLNNEAIDFLVWQKLNSTPEGEKTPEEIQKEETIENKLKKIKIKITPAGICYLSHICQHFEFFAALVNNPLSLYEIDPNLIARRIKFRKMPYYLFTNLISNVIEEVRIQGELMRNFYNLKYKGIKKIEDIKSFLRTDYSFHDPTDTKNYYGLTQIFRIISSHIDYIDKYRLFLLRSSDIPYQNKIKVNEKLIDFLSDYIDILDNSYDDSSFSKNFIATLRIHIRTICKSEFSDFTTSIEYN